VRFGPDDGTSPNGRNLPAYTVAKTRAERLVWALVEELELMQESSVVFQRSPAPSS